MNFAFASYSKMIGSTAMLRAAMMAPVPAIFLVGFVASGLGPILDARGATAADPATSISFARDVLPVLSDRCFHCHGPDPADREADLRLDIEAAAKADLGGYRAIAPGSLEESEVWRRITSDDPDERMPPSDAHRQPLTPKEIDAIRAWILDGATWQKHWAFQPPTRPDPPEGEDHPIDAFIRGNLARHDMAPAPPAAPHTQLRRLSFALTGLAPSESAWQNFVAAPNDQQWRRAVEQILASPQHAERMTMWWLDAARYADSDGYQIDATRENWPWRDWVLHAFRTNMPFDQFTHWQFAGDLFSEATDEQILATSFHRQHMTNGEGGRDPEESRIDYVIDRVNTVGTVWLGLTLGCAQCHAHKFDPISQEDYYALSAFFNNIDEDGKAGMAAQPYLKYASPHLPPLIDEAEAWVATCADREETVRREATERFEAQLQRWTDETPRSHAAWRVPREVIPTSRAGTGFIEEADGILRSDGPDVMHEEYRVTVAVPESMKQVTGWRIEIFPHPNHVGGKFTPYGTGDFILTSVRVLGKRQGDPAESELIIADAIADYEAEKERKSKMGSPVRQYQGNAQ